LGRATSILLAVVLALTVAAPAFAHHHGGRTKPPPVFKGAAARTWSDEWLVCGSYTIAELAREFRFPYRRYTFRIAAQRLAVRAEHDYYGTSVYRAAIDGCFNGILFMHGHHQ
jgi:hypothetical protein